MLQRKEEECISAVSEFSTEYRGSGPNGDERWFYVSSTPSRNQNNHIIWDGIEIDITERKHAEQQLRVLNTNLETRVIERTSELSDALENLKLTQQELIQSEKLAALGALVAGVAHELNTPIGNAVTVSSTLVEAHNELLSKMECGLTRSMLNEFLSTVSEAGAMLTHNLVRAADLVHSFKQVAVDQNNHQRRRFVLEEILNEVRIIMTPALRKSHVTFKQLINNLKKDSNVTKTILDLPQDQLLKALDIPYSHPEGLFAPDTYFFAKGETDKKILTDLYRRQMKSLDEAWAKKAPN